MNVLLLFNLKMNLIIINNNLLKICLNIREKVQNMFLY